MAQPPGSTSSHASGGKPAATHVKEYWQCTWHTGLRFELWRLNPFALTWNFVRDCRDAVLFFFAMRSEGIS